MLFFCALEIGNKKCKISLVWVSTTDILESHQPYLRWIVFVLLLHSCVGGWVRVTDSQPLLQLWPEVQICTDPDDCVFMCKYKTEEVTKTVGSAQMETFLRRIHVIMLFLSILPLAPIHTLHCIPTGRFLPVSVSHRLCGWSICAALWLLQFKASNSWIWRWEWPCCNNIGIPLSCNVTKWNTDGLEAVTQISLSLSLSVWFWIFVCKIICIYVTTRSNPDSFYAGRIANVHIVLQEMLHVCFDSPITHVSFSVWISQSKKKFERECKEAEKSQMMYERLDNDINATKSEVEKVDSVILMYST